MLHLDKVDTLFTEKVQISASGLEELRCYKFYLKLHYEFGSFHSFCVCRSDKSGTIDLSRDKPLRGTYHEIDPMGLFLSVQPSEEVPFGHFITNDSEKPFFYTLRLTSESEKVLDEIHLKKHWIHPLVSKIEVSHEGLYGTILKPPGPGPFPCIINVPGMIGGISTGFAPVFSTYGFLVYNFATFYYKDLPKKIEDVDVEIFSRHLHYLKNHPLCSGKIGLYGLSLSGTVSNFIASRHPKVSAVLSINGPEAFIRDGAVMRENGQLMKCERLNNQLFTTLNGIVYQKSAFLDVYSRLKPETSIQWKQISKDISFRLVSSMDDWLICGVTNGSNVKNQLSKTGHQVEIEFIPGGHAVGVPYFPHQPFTYNKFVRLALGLGGECILQTKAQEKVWENHIKFYTKHLGAPPIVPDYERKTQIILPAFGNSKL